MLPVTQVWNDVGVVIQYNSDDEQSITVEFHDTATHHAIHVSNTLGHVLADLSTSAVLLACEADDKNPRYVPAPLLGIVVFNVVK